MTSEFGDQMKVSTESEVELLGFALSDCVVEINPESAKYLRAVHRTALELAVQNQFGVEVGGFWLLADQISQLRRLPEYYPPDEARVVEDVVETYLSAQLEHSPMVRHSAVPWDSDSWRQSRQ